MPRYFYIARDTTGGKTSGVEDVPGQDELVSRLKRVTQGNMQAVVK